MHRPPNNDILKQQENASTIAGGNPNATSSNFGVNPNPVTNNLRDEVARVYFEESNLTKTVAHLFVNDTKEITWKYYDHSVQEGGYKAAVTSGRAFEYWEPFFCQRYYLYVSIFATLCKQSTNIY